VKTRDEIAREEMTRDPIFLLQVRHGKRDVWKIVTVFFTREEAEAWAEAHEYRWQEWQVWCGYATGSLCEVLRLPETVSAGLARAFLLEGGAAGGPVIGSARSSHKAEEVQSQAGDESEDSPLLYDYDGDPL
jgi:hypothetical protein